MMSTSPCHSESAILIGGRSIPAISLNGHPVNVPFERRLIIYAVTLHQLAHAPDAPLQSIGRNLVRHAQDIARH
jgi:hypothetical protein